jgi:hypothetical protein
MGKRITWRSRHRGDYPWLYATRQVQLADILAGPPFEYEELIGPLPAQAVVELLYRVTRLTFSVSISGDAGDPPAPTTESANGSLALQGLPDELEVFKFNRTTFDVGALLHDSYPFIAEEDADPFDVFLPVDPNGFFPGREHPIYKDENGNFWIQGYFFFNTTNFQVGNFVSEANGAIVPFDATLNLASGSYQIKAYAGYGDDVTAGSLTITATRWNPYAWENGSPNWNRLNGQWLPQWEKLKADFTDVKNTPLIPIL